MNSSLSMIAALALSACTCATPWPQTMRGRSFGRLDTEGKVEAKVGGDFRRTGSSHPACSDGIFQAVVVTIFATGAIKWYGRG